MARRPGDRFDATYHASAVFVSNVIREQRPMFAGADAWREHALSAAKSAVLAAEPDRAGSHARLAKSLRFEAVGVAETLAEAFFVHFLGVGGISTETKRRRVEELLRVGGTIIRIPHDAMAALRSGLAVGRGYPTAFRLWQIYYLLNAVERLSRHEPDLDRLLSAPDRLKRALYAIPLPGTPTWQREMLLHIIDPDSFDPIPWPDIKDSMTRMLLWEGAITSSQADRDARLKSLHERAAETGQERELWEELDAFEEPGDDASVAEGAAIAEAPDLGHRAYLMRPDWFRVGHFGRASALRPASRVGRRAEDVRRPVGIGVTHPEQPGGAIEARLALKPATEYLVWIEIGATSPGIINPDDRPLPPFIRTADPLTVVAFPYERELEVVGDRWGQVTVSASGWATVTRAASLPERAADELLRRRLFYRIRTSSKEGVARLRIGILRKGLLIQSRLLRARVATIDEAKPASLSVVTDYSLAVAPTGYVPERHDAAIIVNENAVGEYGIRIVRNAEDGTPVLADSILGAGQIGNALAQERRAMRVASWGSTDEWADNAGCQYLFSPPNRDQLISGLVTLARAGRRLFAALRVAVSTPNPDAFFASLRPAQRLQIAHTDVAGHYFPAAMVYDIPLDPTLDAAEYEVCSTFLGAIDQNLNLEALPCFLGDVDHLDGSDTTVCPGGFWGYRHLIGFPPSVPNWSLPDTIKKGDRPACLAAAWLSFPMWAGHWNALKSGIGANWSEAEDRSAFLRSIRGDDHHLIYLYCHGGLDPDKLVPYVRIGRPHERPIEPTNFVEGVRWLTTTPLVFINGCRSTASTPEMALQFVSMFTRVCRASAVIGTEVTVFEPLATRFGQAFLEQFVGYGADLASAVRSARLVLLAAMDPMGLAYIPFGHSTLRFVAAP